MCLNGCGPPAGRISVCSRLTEPSHPACICVPGGTECLGCWKNQSRSNPAGRRCFDAPPTNCTCAAGSCALRTVVPPSLAVICMHSGRRFVLQRRIWPKYNFKGDAPPSVSSAGRIFAEREAFIFVVRRAAYRFFCTLWRILQFSSGVFCSRMFARVPIDIRQTDRCRYRDVEQQDWGRAAAACTT